MEEKHLRWFTLATFVTALLSSSLQNGAEQSQGAYFLPEFALSPQGSFLEDTTGEQFLTYRFDDQMIVKEKTGATNEKDMDFDNESY